MSIKVDDILNASYQFLPTSKWLQTDAFSNASKNSGLPYRCASEAAAAIYSELSRSGLFTTPQFLKELDRYLPEITRGAAIHPLQRLIAEGHGHGKTSLS